MYQGLAIAEANTSIDTRIAQLEAELKKLKNKSVPSIPLKKSVLATPKNNTTVESQGDSDEPDDLSDLVPLEEMTPIQKAAAPSAKEKTVSAPAIADVKTSTQDRALELYDQAKSMFGQKKLDQAQQIFQEITTAYPDSPYFIIAQYWCGELALNKQDYMAASLAYGAIFEKYKAGKVGNKFRARVAESLIKFAYCLKMLKKNAEACVILDEFNKEFKDVAHNIQKFATETRTLTSCPKK